MKNRTVECPHCGKRIFRYAQVCPYCKGETKFVSIDDEESQSRIEEELPESPSVSAPEAEEPEAPETPETVSEQVSDDQQDASPKDSKHHGKMSKYIDHLKKDTEKVREEYEEKIGRRFSKSAILIGTVILLLSITVLSLYIAVQMMSHETFGRSMTVDRSMKLTIDSVENKVLQDSKILAKFPDRKRHCLLYLQDNKLHFFDGATRVDSVLNLPELNPQAIVDKEGGILDAYLTPNEQSLVMIVSRAPGNTECGLYRIDIKTKAVEVIDQGQVVRDKDGFLVTNGRRKAIYDSTGDKIGGMTGKELADMEAAEAAAEKAKADAKKTEEKKTEEKKTEEAAPVLRRLDDKKADDKASVTKPVTTSAPEKIQISPAK